ncbi:hypothetical protein NL64_06275 [Pseudomonas fluorescens]|nr:hypothetical protein NL64_06275 [Pseudomonas fluorescens]
MRFNDIRWEHLAAIHKALRHGASVPDALTEVGLTPALWRRLRGDWHATCAHLASVDPTGHPVEVADIDVLISERRGLGGRLPGSLDLRPRAPRHTKGRPLPTLQVQDSSFCVEGGVFYIEDEG